MKCLFQKYPKEVFLYFPIHPAPRNILKHSQAIRKGKEIMKFKACKTYLTKTNSKSVSLIQSHRKCMEESSIVDYDCGIFLNKVSEKCWKMLKFALAVDTINNFYLCFLKHVISFYVFPKVLFSNKSFILLILALLTKALFRNVTSEIL